MASPPRGKRPHSRVKTVDRGQRNSVADGRDPDWAVAARRLEADILAEVLEEGARLPTEAALCRRLGVNRHSLRRAIEVLAKRGIVRRISHVGAFVAPRRIRFDISACSTASAGLERFGLRRGHDVLSHRYCRPPVAVARRLGVAQRTEVIEVVHLSKANNEPFSHVTTWLSADRFSRVGDIMEVVGNVREALAQLGVGVPQRKSVHITSRRVSKQEAKLLMISANANVIVLDSLCVDPSGEPTHVSQCIVDAGRVELVIDL